MLKNYKAIRKNFSLFLGCFALVLTLFGCKPAPVEGEAIKLDIVNGCGQIDAAIQFKEVVPSGKLTVTSISNASNFNYDKTILVSHTEDQVEINIVKTLLKINEVSVIVDTVSATKFTVYLGNDYKKIIERIRND